MKFVSTFVMGFKYLWKDPFSVGILTVFPIVLIFILGTALDGNLAAGEIEIPPSPVAVVADMDGLLGTFLQTEGIAELFELTFTDLQTAEELILNGNIIAAFVETPDGDGVSVLRRQVGGLQLNIAMSVIEAYNQIGTAAAIAISEGRIPAFDADVIVSTQPLRDRVPRAIEYYAITMLVMILLYTGMNGMELFQKGLTEEMGDRMSLAPITKPTLIGGLLAASTTTSFLQGLITFAFTGIVYGVYWGERIPLVLVTLFVMVLFSQSLCILLLVVTNNYNVTVGITQMIIFVSTFVSGGFMEVSFSEALNRIVQFAPNAMAHTVIFGAIYGGDESRMMFSLAILFGLCVVIYALMFLFGRRRLA